MAIIIAFIEMLGGVLDALETQGVFMGAFSFTVFTTMLGLFFTARKAAGGARR